MFRLRFAVVYAFFALILAGSAYGAFRGGHAGSTARHRAAPATCKAPSVGGDPMVTALYFIHTAVERTNPGAGFALATPALRGTTTCADWLHGKLPVTPFRQIDWDRAQYRVETRATRQIVLDVLLASKLKLQPAMFVLELRQIGTLWRVGFWGPAAVTA
jgi:hypothetical protein